jgi:hypothetical protein
MTPTLFYLESSTDFDSHWPLLKQVACPHCHQVGFLNRHGYLRGYCEDTSETMIRGWRVFCSDRRPEGSRGCGRTYSLLLAHLLHRRSITTLNAWKFLTAVLLGLTLAAAWFTVVGKSAVECAHHLWNSWKRAQGAIRSRLSAMSFPPKSTQTDPLFQPLEHLQALFPKHPNPMAAFQIYFQKPFFSTS